MKHTFCRLLTTILFALSTAAFAQNPTSDNRCGTAEAHAAMLQRHPQFALKRAELEQAIQGRLKQQPDRREHHLGDTIPVVFHVVYNTPLENISDAQIWSQLEVLNEDFNRMNPDAAQTPAAFKPVAGNPQITFCLATLDPNGLPTTGITRTKTTRTSFGNTDIAMKFDSQGGKNAWNPELYLNIWVVNLEGDNLGFAQFPGGAPETDGIVLRYLNTGRFPVNPFRSNYNLGRTGTHEAGHYFGLRHIWGEDETSCTDSDLVEDTPNQQGHSAGCPTFPKISCQNAPAGDMFMNYMDYTNDACMNLFTQGQAARMHAFLHSSRSSLLSSNVCSNKLNADFRAVPDAVLPGQTTNFFYYSNGRRPATFFWEFDGGVPATSTQANPRNIRYDKPGNYTVKLTVTEGGATDTEVKIGYLKVTTSELQLYPNPASTVVAVGAPAGQQLREVEIFNTAGQRVFQAASLSREVEIDISRFGNGLYIVRGSTDSGRYLSRRLLILK